MKETASGDVVIEKSDVGIILADNSRNPVLFMPKFDENEEVPEYCVALLAVYVRMQKDYAWYSELLEWFEGQKGD